MFSGSGTGLFDIPQSAISGDTVRIASGSVTASVSPAFGFRVASFVSGSDFSGSIRIDSSSFIYSLGTFLREIPRAALTEDALVSSEIKSGSVTASVSPDFGFKVTTPFTSSLSFDNVFTVTNDGSGVYNISNGLISGSNPTLTLHRNYEYVFNVNANGHPFWINSASAIGVTNGYNSWVTNNGEDVGQIRFLVSGSAPNTLYYNCQLHSSMAGVINIVNGNPNFIYDTQIGSRLTGSVDISGSLFINEISGGLFLASSSVYYGEGTFLRNIPRSALTEDALVSTEIKSGSVTASVSPDFGFRVQTKATGSQIGSQFTGSIDISGSIRAFAFIGDGSQITNVQAAASPLIASGSATASVASGDIFVVTTGATGSGQNVQFGSKFTGSVDISGSIKAQFILGDGSFITNVQAAAAPFIGSGSATASVQSGDTFVVTTGATGSAIGSRFTGSIDISGSVRAFSFSGDGSQLTNVQASAAPLIASGSATASVQSGIQFIVTTKGNFSPVGANSGSYYGAIFTGSVNISGSLSASRFDGDGGGLFNIPASALEDLQLDRIQSGSGRAIIDPLKLDVNVPITAALYIGDGGGLFNIPANALQDLKLDRVISGSVEGVISTNKGFEVNTNVRI